MASIKFFLLGLFLTRNRLISCFISTHCLHPNTKQVSTSDNSGMFTSPHAINLWLTAIDINMHVWQQYSRTVYCSISPSTAMKLLYY